MVKEILMCIKFLLLSISFPHEEKCDNKIKQVFFIFNFKGITSEEKALTLVGPSRDNPVLDP